MHLVTGVAETREGALGLVEKYHDRHLADRVFELAWTHSQVVLAAARRDRGRHAALRPARQQHPVRQPAAPRPGQRDRAQPPRAVGPVGLRHLRRPADRAAARRRRGADPPRPPARAGARLLAGEGAGGRPGHLERRPVRLPAGAAGPDHGRDRVAGRGEPARQAGRHLRPPQRADVGGGQGPDADGRAGDPQRHRRHAGRAGGAPRPRRDGRAARSAPSAPAGPSRRSRWRCERRDLAAFNGIGGFTRDGREYVITTTAESPTPAPWVNVLANPWFGTVVSESGGAYTWCENAHALPPHARGTTIPSATRAAKRSTSATKRPAGSGRRRRCPRAGRCRTRRATASATASSSTPRTASRRRCGRTSRPMRR